MPDRLPLEEARSRLSWLNLSYRKCVVADDGGPVGRHVDLGRLDGLCMARIPMNPRIERLLAAAERPEIVLAS